MITTGVWSLPSRERGLKSAKTDNKTTTVVVAPFAGAWIEICCGKSIQNICSVAPFAGAWIEIYDRYCGGFIMARRSLRGSVD